MSMSNEGEEDRSAVNPPNTLAVSPVPTRAPHTPLRHSQSSRSLLPFRTPLAPPTSRSDSLPSFSFATPLSYGGYPVYYSPTPAPHGPPSGQQDAALLSLEATFARGLFDEILSGAKRLAKRTRATFHWPENVTDEDRALVACRCLRRLGYESFSGFLYVLLAKRFTSKEQNFVARWVSEFLSSTDTSQKIHPLHIVDLIYEHSASQAYTDRRPTTPNFLIPRYARPPSTRLDNTFGLSTLPSNTTRNALLNWALAKILGRVDDEAQALLSPSLKLVRQPGEHYSWEALTSLDMTFTQESIAKEAPVLFSILSTLSISPETRIKYRLGNEHGEADMEVDEVSEELPIEEGLLGEGSHPGVPEGMLRDPWFATTASILCLLFFRYKYAIIFPAFFGLFLFSCNVNRDVISALGKLGVTISYTTILSVLQKLAVDTGQHLQHLASALSNHQPTFLLLFDNINKMRRAWQHTVHHQDELQNGTAATFIRLEDVPPNALKSEPILDNMKKKGHLSMSIDTLYSDINWEHMHSTGAATILKAWVKHVPELQRFNKELQDMYKEHLAVHKLRLRKSKIIPMRPTAIDESTSHGIVEVLRNLVLSQLNVLPEWLQDWVIFVCGDQMTIDRLRKLKQYTAKADTPHDRNDWVLPVIQLWHLKWNWMKNIFKLHWFNELERDVHGLHHDVNLLRREKFNAEKCDFYQGHHIIEDRFEAMVLEILRLKCEERTEISTPKQMHLLDSLAYYFGKNGSLESISFDDISSMATDVYANYATFAAAEATLRPPVAHTTPPTRTGADESLANSMHFLRVALWYLEICAAIAEGDIGRVLEVIKVLRFSFWGAGSTNYGNELLEMAANFLYDFPEDLKTALLNNYLVNPSGLPGHWQELDLLQEHFNYWLKRLFNTKSHDFESRHLSEVVGLNISGFSLLRDRFPSIFGFRRSGKKHRDPDKSSDINILGQHYREVSLFSRQLERRQPKRVVNEFEKGMSILANGQLDRFKTRTTTSGHVNEEPVVDDVAFDRQPSNPVTSVNGSIEVTDFIGIPDGIDA
ncbi:hypothetical protein BKA70DRAFT_1525370 [Coprinopsis sp. MPI-PUGE-AT-0042]|nr:hypothetical protein BKA70DRAFT_1525370 [Coprinopsis sp. MPI-PUGE-AT-0042]